MAQVKAVMSSREFTGWLVEFGLQNEEQEDYARAVRVQAELDKK